MTLLYHRHPTQKSYNPKLCGIKQFQTEDDERYIVFLFKTNENVSNILPENKSGPEKPQNSEKWLVNFQNNLEIPLFYRISNNIFCIESLFVYNDAKNFYTIILLGGIYMKLRAPAYPLITCDPYFSLWSMGDTLNGSDTRHWTEKPQVMEGKLTVDGETYVFMGDAKRMGLNAMHQVSVDVDAFSTSYLFENASIRLTAIFTSPVIPTDLELISRPVSYLKLKVDSLDGVPHDVHIQITAMEEFCLDYRRQCPVLTAKVDIGEGISAMRMGSLEQPVLGRSGDDLRIDWGYFYLCTNCGTVTDKYNDGVVQLVADIPLNTDGDNSALVAFAYDDIASIRYFGKPLQAYWRHRGHTIEEVIAQAFDSYDDILRRCQRFHETLQKEAIKAGGEKYAELLTLALRQVVAAHKLVLDEDGQVLFISKECYSNGCAATVDVSYPSTPLFLLYNVELVKGMMRPIFRYAASEIWPFDFAPHDCGRYPILNGQVYSRGVDPKNQMPVEECGNMLIMASAITAVEKDASFASQYRTLLDQWAEYLLKVGVDPDNQLCTDDFAGHLAHNCNLSLKSIIALGAYARVCKMMGDDEAAARYGDAARHMAQEWVVMADDGNGSYRLAFDQPGTFSMKYNLVWDQIFGLGLFPDTVRKTETKSYLGRLKPYGLPLDNRADYTKSDWTLWVATLADDRETFQKLSDPVWLTYHKSPSRVPMNDWYSTITSLKIGFQNRTVQGGLFIKILADSKNCRF